MRKVAGERILKVVTARRKGRGGHNQTEFELGVGYLVDANGDPTGKVVIRTEQVDTGVPPIVAILDAGIADDFSYNFIDAIGFATGAVVDIKEEIA